METTVGLWWDRFITRHVRPDHAAAAVAISEGALCGAILLRAFGGDPVLRVATAPAETRAGPRRWLARLSGADPQIALARMDESVLELPGRVALFAERALNRDLYVWLLALAGTHAARVRVGLTSSDWMCGNQADSAEVLVRFPGLRARYARLVAAHLAQRIPAERLTASAAAMERAVRAALVDPAAVQNWPVPRTEVQPIPLWLTPAPTVGPASPAGAAPEHAQVHRTRAIAQDRTRRRAHRDAATPARHGFLLPFRAEGLLSWAEYVRVQRTQDEDDEVPAGAAAQTRISLARDTQASRARVRFDLDLPAPAQDDLPLGPGLLLPEWDCRQQSLRPDYVRVQPLRARPAAPCALPAHLVPTARRLRRQFETLRVARRWRHGETEGAELDLDAVVRDWAERGRGAQRTEPALFASMQRATRDLACVVMADLSWSTDAWVAGEQRVIDVIRDTLLLFGEALGACRDPCAFYGFSSLKRSLLRVHSIKEFDEPCDDALRARIAALRPGYYTRLGAAIRFATHVLRERTSALRLLLLLTDGKPHDIDHYEGRYALEDTAAAVRAARAEGIQPYCITIDRDAHDYLPRLFGPRGHCVVRATSQLPSRLPGLYARLTA